MNTGTYFDQSKFLWPANKRDTCVEALRREINRKHGLQLKDYHDLHKYSVENDKFWLDLWESLAIISSVPPQANQIITPGNFPEIPTWFPDARLNFAENLLYKRDDAIALVEASETGIIAHITFRQLRERVRVMAASLLANGLRIGDRVAAIITNSTTAVVIALAVASIGGMYSSTATDMGTQGILDRYEQIQPKFVFAETEVLYAGQKVNILPKVAEVIKGLSEKGLQRGILLPSRISGQELTIPDMSKRLVTRLLHLTLSEFLGTGDDRPLVFEQLPFGQPLFILYSSGTSGKPKCIVHCAGGVLLNTKKEHRMVFNMTEADTYFQYTTTGWMVWPFMIVGLSCGSRVVLYDGSPFHPDLKTFMRFVSDQGVTIWGISPRFLTETYGRDVKPLQVASFEALRAMAVTGAVLTAPMFEFVHEAFGHHIHIASVSGGTDICGGFVTGTPSLPVYAGEIQCKALGMKVEVFDPSGNNIDHTGQPGELVCTRPHPSLPIMFWGDESGKRLREAYFSVYPGVWRQGDFMVVNPVTKGIMILGRSDGVLNPSGVRFGSGEIYSVMEQFSDRVDDSLCVGQRRPQDKDERVFLFLKMRRGQQFTPELVLSIKASIKKHLSARHVPAFIFEVGDIPYTTNNKKIEIAVKQIVSGSNLVPSGAVANPEALKLYYKYRDLENVVEEAKAKL